MTPTSLTRRQFLATGSCALGALAIGGNARAAEEKNDLTGVPISTTFPETSASLKVKDPSRITILQLTDAHLHQPRPEVPDAHERTMAEWKHMVERYKPDLIAVTGDLWHENHENRGEEYMRDGIEKVSSLDVPWVFTWGNHDNLTKVPVGHDAIHSAKHSLYRGGPASGNYTVDILGPDGKPVWELICMNTHQKGIVGVSHDWLKTLSESRAAQKSRPPAFALFHIPIKQYLDARQSATMGGIMMEGVSSGDEDGSALDLLSKLGTVRACFCGHDHKSDYSGTQDGIELVYGRSSGWNAYGWAEVRKGAKLITANAETGNYAWETVFADGVRWHPKAGEKIEAIVDQPWMQAPKKASAAA